MTLRFDTSEYEQRYCKSPKGRGSWAFRFNEGDQEPWFTLGCTTYTEAKRLARAEAAARLANVAYVLT